MRFESNGIFFPFIIRAICGSFITLSFTRSRCARLVNDPGKHNRFAALWFHQARERSDLYRFQIVADTFAKFERAIFSPNFGGFRRHVAISR
jgi:hypothetical protein